jgi:hypothetical protein
MVGFFLGRPSYLFHLFHRLFKIGADFIHIVCLMLDNKLTILKIALRAVFEYKYLLSNNTLYNLYCQDKLAFFIAF